MRILIISVTVAGVLLGFQNCGQVSFENALPSENGRLGDVASVDMTAPRIRIISSPGVLKQGEMAAIEYEITDDDSGVASSTCGFAKPLGTKASCPLVARAELGDSLAAGTYTYEIEASDRDGNTSNEKVNFEVTAKSTICDPLSTSGDKNCKGGLVGDIFYLRAAQQDLFKAMANKTVDYFYSAGQQVNAVLALSELNVPTREFTAGFPSSSSGALIADEAGNVLNEYFAFRLETVLKLDPQVDSPGFYQLALVSDDGSMLLTKGAGASTYNSTLISNDGDHSTRAACAANAIYLDNTTRIPLQLKYYQGPRTKIALMFKWRRVASMDFASDPNCNGAADVSSGMDWKIIAPGNLVAPAR